jgi:hypothetical protein
MSTQFREGAHQIYLTKSNAVKEYQKQLIERWNSIVEAQNEVLARLIEFQGMIYVHHVAVTDMLSTTEHLGDVVRQQILTANVAFYDAIREEAARKGGH